MGRGGGKYITPPWIVGCITACCLFMAWVRASLMCESRMRLFGSTSFSKKYSSALGVSGASSSGIGISSSSSASLRSEKDVWYLNASQS
jgi:hypothetical protein